MPATICYSYATLLLRREITPLAVTTTVALFGFVLALFGTYWDDAWHTDKGRDSFLIAPHICLYAGITLVGAAVGLEVSRRVRSHGLRALGAPAIALSCLGVLVTLLAAPIDNAWHVAFGRDAVLWSPPHMLGVGGSLALAVGLTMLLIETRHRHGLRLIAAAAIVAVGTIPVLEYETDVPQFALVWFLPLLTFGAAFGLGLARTLLSSRWSATGVAGVYTALRLLIAGVLSALALPIPMIPLLLLPAIALDYVLQRSGSRALAATTFAVLLFGAYIPYLNWLKSDIFIDATDVVFGLPLGIALAYLALLLAGQPREANGFRPSLATAVPVALVLAVSLSSSASAHDPGQGEEAAPAQLAVTGYEDGASLSVDLGGNPGCLSYEPVGLVARRAGAEIEAPLQPTARCRFSGAVELSDRGRWFIYARFERGEEALETWLPVHVGSSEAVSAQRDLYYPPEVSQSPLKAIAGVVVYGFFVTLVIAIARLVRRPVAPV